MKMKGLWDGGQCHTRTGDDGQRGKANIERERERERERESERGKTAHGRSIFFFL